MKICTKCGKEKDINGFGTRKNSKDGRNNICKDCQKQYHQKYYKFNFRKWKEYNNLDENKREKRKAYCKEYAKNNKEIVNKSKRKYDMKRKTDNVFRLKCRLRDLFRKSLKRQGYSKSSHTYEILGIPYKDCLDYLFENAKLRYSDFESKDFLENNKYHVDHIVPLAIAKNEEEVIKLCHYTNLQLLTKEDNLEKSDNLDWRLYE